MTCVGDPASTAALCTPWRCHWNRAAAEQASWPGTARGLSGCSLPQFGAAPWLCLHHHHSLGAFLLLLASCLPQHRVQNVGFHLQTPFKLFPAVSYVVVNRLLLYISKCQCRGSGSSGIMLCTVCQYVFSHSLLKPVFVFL